MMIRTRMVCSLGLMAAPIAFWLSQRPSPAHPQLVTVDTSAPGAPISADALGVNLGVWFDFTQPGATAAIGQARARLLRWPGGSFADLYHWQTQTACNHAPPSPAATFRNFVKNVVVPGRYDLAVTLNYGSDQTCTRGGSPAEAAAWVGEAKRLGLTGLHWTVGNEAYGDWEYDSHAKKHDPATYAASIGGADGYYALAKASDPAAQIGVVITGSATAPAWDKYVLAHAPYDFVELHYYAEGNGYENDAYLLTSGVTNLTATITTLKAELAAAGKPNTPIYLGEFNSVTKSPGKQTMSIVNGLYAGMALGEVLNAGLPMASWWMGIGAGCGTGGNNSPSLYGWQTVGTYGQMADNWPNPYSCVGGPAIPFGTLLPSGQAMRLAARFATPGDAMLPVRVPAGLAKVRAYAATADHAGGRGYALMLFNLDANHPVTVGIGLAGAHGSFAATATTYGRAQYDESKANVWSGPVTTPLDTSATPTLTLPPWSMSVVTLQPANN